MNSQCFAPDRGPRAQLIIPTIVPSFHYGEHSRTYPGLSVSSCTASISSFPSCPIPPQSLRRQGELSSDGSSCSALTPSHMRAPGEPTLTPLPQFHLHERGLRPAASSPLGLCPGPAKVAKRQEAQRRWPAPSGYPARVLTRPGGHLEST